MKKIPDKRNNYLKFYKLNTRWKDNDIYGHVNNVVYYEYFDTSVNLWLIENNLLNLQEARYVGYIVESGCNYFSPISHPSEIFIGIKASKVGNSSVTYKCAVFKDSLDECSAQGFFTHVYVDRKKEISKPISLRFREKLKLITLD